MQGWSCAYLDNKFFPVVGHQCVINLIFLKLLFQSNFCIYRSGAHAFPLLDAFLAEICTLPKDMH